MRGSFGAFTLRLNTLNVRWLFFATMVSSSNGLRLLKCMEVLKMKPSFDAITVLQKVNLQSISDGVVKGSFKIEPMMCNIGGSLHGAYLASVTDVISFYSVLSNPDGKFAWTTTLNVAYIKSGRIGETVNVETKPLVNGVSPITEVYFHNGDGKLLAKGTATFLVAGEEVQRICKKMFNYNVHQEKEQ